MVILGAVVALICLAAAWGAARTLASTPPKGAKYVGAKKCRSCHPKPYKTWRKTKHYKTFKKLEGGEKKNPDCLKCHTTGYGQPGGFVSEEETPKMTGTGCESCHGRGSAHIEAAKNAPETGKWDKMISKVPLGTACANCHNPHISQKARIKKLRAEGKTGR